MREIELHLDPERINPNVEQTQKAGGRLSTCSLSGYPTVKIYHDGNGFDLIAYYHDEGRNFTIGAVWREAEYTFHS